MEPESRTLCRLQQPDRKGQKLCPSRCGPGPADRCRGNQIAGARFEGESLCHCHQHKETEQEYLAAYYFRMRRHAGIPPGTAVGKFPQAAWGDIHAARFRVVPGAEGNRLRVLLSRLGGHVQTRRRHPLRRRRAARPGPGAFFYAAGRGHGGSCQPDGRDQSREPAGKSCAQKLAGHGGIRPVPRIRY